MKKKIYSFLAAAVIGLTTILSPLNAFAAGGLELYTDYPGMPVKAGDSQSISLYLENDSGTGVDADLSIFSIPDGWEGCFSGNGSQISRVHVQNGSEAAVTFNLQIPDEAEEGSYPIQLRGGTPGAARCFRYFFQL